MPNQIRAAICGYVKKEFKRYGSKGLNRYYIWSIKDMMHPRGKSCQAIQEATEKENIIYIAALANGWNIRKNRPINDDDLPF